MILVLTVAPVRAWAESLLAFSASSASPYSRFDPAAMKRNGPENNQLLNQAIGHVISDEVTVTQKPQRPAAHRGCGVGIE